MAAPPWLEPLLSTEFFSGCHVHGDAPRSECNMYCLDCNAGAFCFYCRSARHKDHHVVQIRRSSYHDVVRVAEIQQAVDIGGVQTYVINSARVIFLNERPQPKAAAAGAAGAGSGNRGGGGGAGGGGAAHHHHHSHACEICGRSLLEPLRFCSLGCKLAGVKRNGNASFNLGAKDEMPGERREGVASSRRGITMSSGEELEHRPSRKSSYSSNHGQPPSAARSRRKGIPHRAPFRS